MGVKKINGLEDFVNKFVRARGGDSTGLDAVAPVPAPTLIPLVATGGTTNDYPDGGKTYRAHIFNTSGAFAVTQDAANGMPDNVEYLIVAGGGGGGGEYQGGGGGAGGLRTNLAGHPLSTNNPAFPVSTTGGNGSGSYPVIIGAGGNGATVASTAGVSGDYSYFGPPSAPNGIRAEGGGGGGGYNRDGVSGGSGGGTGDNGGTTLTEGYGYNPSTPAPVLSPVPLSHPYTITQGNNGGNAGGTYGAPFVAAGGGGAGGNGLGSDGDNIQAYEGNGGLGSQVLIAGPSSHPGVGAPGPNGQEQWYAGGGGGGGYPTAPSTSGDGGAGPATNAPNSGWSGGGPGGPNGTGGAGPGVNGTTNAGGGGGGAVDFNKVGGNGGSGIVIIRYEL